MKALASSGNLDARKTYRVAGLAYSLEGSCWQFLGRGKQRPYALDPSSYGFDAWKFSQISLQIFIAG
jgi:hypothetical protein